jgi:hypothetical protein
MVCFEKLNESWIPWIPKKIRIDDNQGTPDHPNESMQSTANSQRSTIAYIDHHHNDMLEQLV